MRRTIGYYVHHHGAGHRRRYEAIRAAVDRTVSVVPLSQLQLDDVVRLPPDAPSAGTDETAGGSLHWAPVPDPNMAIRNGVVLDWLRRVGPAGVVVDVSVEHALLCRLSGVPTIVVRQHGTRTDSAHEVAYKSACRLLAPFPREIECPSTPAWVVDKTDYAGFITDRPWAKAPTTPTSPPSADDVVVLWGNGGGRVTAQMLRRLAFITSPHHVWCVGRADRFDAVVDEHISYVGWVDAPAELLEHRPTVFASAGNNTVAAVAEAGCPLVLIPQPRPFDEQVHHAASLEAHGLAAVVAGDSTEEGLRIAIQQARRSRDRLHRLADGHGAERAAELIATGLKIPSSRTT